MATDPGICVAVTGPTGTLGFGLIPLLDADPRISRLIGIARRPFDPAQHGWTKMEYRRGDVRDAAVLEEAFRGADVVVHLAFVILGGRDETTRAINVEGTLNAFRAAAASGAQRFVFASSVAAYGFHRDNPVGIKEDWPVRPARSLSYGQAKAELEQRLLAEAAEQPELGLYLVRPSIVLGPHAVGAKLQLPGLVGAIGRRVRSGREHPVPVPLPVIVPDLPVQFVHEDDLGRALLQCVIGAGPPGAYNIAADDVLSIADVARELGFVPVRVPGAPVAAAAGLVARLPLLPAKAQWLEALSHPAIMNTNRAKSELNWTPQHTARDALRDTLRHRD